MLVGDAAEIFERPQVVLGDAVAIGVHPAEFPLGDRVAAFGGVLQRVQRVGRWRTAAGGIAFFRARGGPGLGRNHGNRPHPR